MNLYRLEDQKENHLTGLISLNEMVDVISGLDRVKVPTYLVKRFKVVSCDVTVTFDGLLEADKAWPVLVNDSNA